MFEIEEMEEIARLNESNEFKRQNQINPHNAVRDQARLIEERTRLIEERTRLDQLAIQVEEQNLRARGLPH